MVSNNHLDSSGTSAFHPFSLNLRRPQHLHHKSQNQWPNNQHVCWWNVSLESKESGWTRNLARAEAGEQDKFIYWLRRNMKKTRNRCAQTRSLNLTVQYTGWWKDWRYCSDIVAKTKKTTKLHKSRKLPNNSCRWQWPRTCVTKLTIV